MVHFMDIAEDEIQKNYKDIRLNKLESLLEISLRITSANSDPFKDDLRVKLFTNDLKTMLLKVQSYETQFGLNSFCLIYFNFYNLFFSLRNNQDRNFKGKTNRPIGILTRLCDQMANIAYHQQTSRFDSIFSL